MNEQEATALAMVLITFLVAPLSLALWVSISLKIVDEIRYRLGYTRQRGLD